MITNFSKMLYWETSSKTLNEFRAQFRLARIQPGKTYWQFSIKLNRLFEQYLQSSEISSISDLLRTFMVLDQFLSPLNFNFRPFIKEREVNSLETTI